MRSVTEWFECEDGYPLDESLQQLRNTEFDPFGAAKFLVNDLEQIVSGISCVKVRKKIGVDRFDDKPAWKIEYHTGGWSGAEALIDIILLHFWLMHFHVSWETGGHFYFEVAEHFLNQRLPK